MDGLIAGQEPLNRQVLSTVPNLKAVARAGIGVDNVDFDAAAELGIKVSNTPDGPTQAVAELTTAAMLSLCRQIPQMNKGLHEKQWNKMISLGLSKTLPGSLSTKGWPKPRSSLCMPLAMIPF